MELNIIVVILVGEQVVEIMERRSKEDMSMSELIENKNWYFTFGCGQEHAGYYVKITAPYIIARDWMFKKYGQHWSFMYGEDDALEMIAKWNYKELEHITEEPIIEDTQAINTSDRTEKEDIQ